MTIFLLYLVMNIFSVEGILHVPTGSLKPGCVPPNPDLRCVWFNDQCKSNDFNCPAGEICCGDQCGTACSKPVCDLPKVTGPCLGDIVRLWYYDKVTDSCRRFNYGECAGNANSFTSLDDCNKVKSTCACRLPKYTGPCKASIDRYYYNHKSGRCEKFIYGGCQANKNNFETLQACKTTCGDFPNPSPIIINRTNEKPGKCPVPTEVGICVEKCSKDGDCKGTQKCCSNGCGHTCTDVLPVVKPGFCPLLPPNTVGHCAEICTGDASCPGTQKCCSNGCGHECSFPTGGIKPPPCPVGNPLTKTGSSGLVYCGKIPNNQSCPKGYYCNGVVCCQQVCKFGPPLNGIFCGRGSERKDCPKGYSCNIAPNDAYAICCPSGKME